MKRAGTLHLTVPRFTPFERVFRFPQRALSGAAAELQVRQAWNQSGAALITVSTAGGAQGGIVFSTDGADTLMTVSITEAAIEALPLAAERAADLPLVYDIQIDPADAPKQVWIRGNFIVQGGSVQ